MHEDFIGMYHVNKTDAESLMAAVTDILLRLNLPLSMCRGQCYDGAAVMAGVKSGVATLIQKVREGEPDALINVE